MLQFWAPGASRAWLVTHRPLHRTSPFCKGGRAVSKMCPKPKWLWKWACTDIREWPFMPLPVNPYYDPLSMFILVLCFGWRILRGACVPLRRSCRVTHPKPHQGSRSRSGARAALVVGAGGGREAAEALRARSSAMQCPGGLVTATRARGAECGPPRVWQPRGAAVTRRTRAWSSRRAVSATPNPGGATWRAGPRRVARTLRVSNLKGP